MLKHIFSASFFFLVAANAFSQTGKSEFKSVYISTIPKPTAPANLDISEITFSDRNGNTNNVLDADERAEIQFTIANRGKGNAYALVMQIEELNFVSGIQFSKTQNLENLVSGETKKISVPLSASMKLPDGKANFKISIKEGNGFDADPFTIEFNTQKFKNPQLVIADHLFTNNEGEGKIKLGQSMNLKIIVQNQGQGTASDVHISFNNPDNVFPANETNFYFKSLEPNQSEVINYEFLTNKRYSSSEIPIQVAITESYGKYGENKPLKVSLEQTLDKTQQVQIDAVNEKAVRITEVSLLSDVDKNIPENPKINKNRYALIIGNEDYVTHQQGLQSESNVEFARNDAKVFKDYCEKTLGIPTENITYRPDATAGTMKQSIDKLNKLIKNSGGKIEVIFYYAGHGFPDEKTQEAYLIPVDVSGSNLQSALKLNDVYQALTEHPCENVTVFLDACFSGGARNQPLLAARAIKIKPRESIIKGNMVVFSASSGDQISLPYREKQHGMFTYFLLKKMQETRGDVTYRELFDYVNSKVSFESVKKNDKEQNPRIQTSDDLRNVWEKRKIR